MSAAQPTPSNPRKEVRPSGETASRVYENWRERFVRPMLIGALVFGFFALVLGLSTNQGLFQNVVFITAYILLAAATFLPVPYTLRMSAFLFAVYALGLIELLSTGILGDTSFFFLGLMTFAALMFSATAGFVALGATMVTFAAVGVLVGTGSIHLLHPQAINAP